MMPPRPAPDGEPHGDLPGDRAGPCAGPYEGIAATFPQRALTLSRPTRYAVRMAAACASPNSSTACSRSLNFWILPVTVIGKASVKRQ